MDILLELLPLFTQYGHIAVFVVLLICGMGLPLPEDIVLIAAGIIAGLGYVDPTIMLINAMVGVLLGDAIIFIMGTSLGKQIKHWPFMARLMDKEHTLAVRKKFARYGQWILFLARFLPGLRAPIFLTAGLSHHVKFWRFLLIDTLAAAISVPLWVFLGIYAAERLGSIEHFIHQGHQGIVIIMVLALAVIIAFGWYEYKKHCKTKPL